MKPMNQVFKGFLAGVFGFLLVTPATVNADVCVNPPSRLVNWWPGDGNANDIKGNNNGILQNGVVFASGKVGQAFSFDGVDDYISINGSLFPNPRVKSITIAAWVNPAAFNQIDALVLIGPDEGSPVFKFQIRNSDHKVSAQLRDSSGNANFVTGTSVLSVGNWSHIAMTWNLLSKSVKLYVNGVEEASANNANLNPATLPASIVAIGATTRGGAPFPGGFFNGLMDEIQVYDRPLGASEIQSIFTAGTAGTCPFLPTLEKILFTSNQDGNSEIYAMNPNGTQPIRLTNNPAYDGRASWSPDGKKIVFETDRGGNSNREIYVMNADGTNPTNLTNNPADDFAPQWSPDGNKIAFVSNRDNQLEIYMMNPDGSNQVRFTNNIDVAPSTFSWSPDGTKLVLSLHYQVPNRDLFVINADGTGLTRLTSGNSDRKELPAWSPDGSKIVYRIEYSGTNHAIFVINADGTGQIDLTGNQDANSDPIWSPDGRIAFFSNRSGTNGIWVMNVDGSNLVSLTNHPGGDFPSDWKFLVCNQPPVALCRNVTVNTTVNTCSAPASVDNGSYDPDGSIANALQSPAGPYGNGTTSVTLTVTDNQGASNSCSGTVTVIDNQPPVITCPVSRTVEATGPNGAVASFSGPTVSDNCLGAIAVSCAPSSGSIFPLGLTSVSCGAIDASGNPNSCNFNITVQDTTPPNLAQPGNITIDATSPAGALVNYTLPTATDLVTTTPTVMCNLLPGSTFPIGTTTVSCTATDGANNSSTPKTFTIAVNGANIQISNLIGAIQNVDLPQGTASSLIVKLQNASNSVQNGDVATACSQLTALINEAQAQSGKKLTASQALSSTLGS